MTTFDDFFKTVTEIKEGSYPYQTSLPKNPWPDLREGDALTLAREPANPYDPKAVRVDWRGQKLGYVPRLENTAVSQMLDRGERLTARVVRSKESPDPWERLWFVVGLET